MAAAAMAAVPLDSADAEIVYSGVLNQAAPTGNVSIVGADRFSISNESGLGKGDSYRIALENLSADFEYVGVLEAVTQLSSGDVIDALASYSAASPGQIVSGGEIFSSNWTGAGEAYFGFSFNPSGSQTLYGWARVQYEDGGKGSASTLTLLDFAYEDTGAAITAGAMPPPPIPTLTEWWMMGLATLLAFFGALVAVTSRRTRAV